MTRFLLSLVSVVFCTSPAFAQSSPQLHQDAKCQNESAHALQNRQFSFAKISFEKSDFGILCEANNSQTAVDCVNAVAKAKPFMTPLGVATVCSGGAKGEDAIQCLATMKSKFDEDRWVSVVDACTGTARQASVCAGSENGLTCNALPNGATSNNSVKPLSK